MKQRRNFLKLSALSLIGFSGSSLLASNRNSSSIRTLKKAKNKPIVISTWNFGKVANEEAWKVLSSKGTSLDAIEKGLNIIEKDESNSTVGYGGTPDSSGRVTLDACIMDDKNRCGSVGCLEHIMHPISVARKVMEETPHVMLVGKGAYDFAISQGFKKENMLTQKKEKQWKEWLKKSNIKPPEVNIENHDTIGMLAMDMDGNISGGCTTSGWGYKMPGRIGDSPIIGAGLFLDNEVGGACATGLGEEVIRTAGCAMVVEMMRQGHEPEEACKIIAERTLKKGHHENTQVGFLALRKDGTYGSYSIRKGFNYAIQDSKGNRIEDSKNIL